MSEKITSPGHDSFERIPQGSHACHFYSDQKDIIEILVPYFSFGLERNRHCLWLISDPLLEISIRDAVCDAIPGIRQYLDSAQMEIINIRNLADYQKPCDWRNVIHEINSRLDHASAKGFVGSRIAHAPLDICRNHWPDLEAYEKEIQAWIDDLRISAICAFDQNECRLDGALQISSQHSLILIRREGRWRCIENIGLNKHGALKDNAHRLKSLIQGLPGIYWSKSRTRGLLYASERVEELLGYSHDFMCRHPHLWDESVHPDDQVRFAEALIDLESGKDFDIEYRIRDSSDNWHWFQDRSIGLKRDEYGIVIEGISTDITQRKMLEQELKDSRYIFSETQHAAHVGSWEWKIDQDTLIWSDEAYRQFGLKPDEITPRYQTFEGFIHPEDLDLVNQSIEQAIAGQKTYSVEARMIRKDGSEWIMHAHGTVYRDEKGKPVRFIGTTQDVTDRKVAEKKILESEEKYRQIFSTVPDSLILFDAESLEFIDVNDSCISLYGYTKEEFKRIKMIDITSEPEETNVAISQVLGKKTIRIPRRYHKKKDGSIFPVEVSASSFVLNGRLIICGAIRDNSERIAEEKKLRDNEFMLQEQKIALEQKNIALREIIAQVETEKRKISEKLIANVDLIVKPILKRLREKKSISKYADLIDHHLDGMLSSYGMFISRKMFVLSPRELEICNLVKAGLSNKDISDLLNISSRTVEKHRENIRTKLGLANKEVNLTSYLRET